VGGVLLVLGVVVVGGPLTQAALSIPTEPPVQLRGVRVQPLSGWQVRTAQQGDAALLTRGSGNLGVLSVVGDPAGLAAARRQGPAGLAAWYLERQLAPHTRRLAVGKRRAVRLASGLSGVRVAYQAERPGGGQVGALTGEVTAVVGAGGVGVVFDAWALPETFPYERGDVDHMIATAQVG
jgi:hypothetical protein